MIKKIYISILCLFFLSLSCSDKALIVKTPITNGNNLTLSYDPKNLGQPLDIKEFTLSNSKSLLLNSGVSSTVNILNKKFKSPFLLLVAVEGVSVASDFYLAPGAFLEIISDVLIQEAKQVTPLLIAGSAAGAAASLDENILLDRKVTIYRFVKDGVIITVCLIYPLVFAPSLSLSSVLSSIAVNRMYHLYEDVKSSQTTENNDANENTQNNNRISKKGWIAGIAVSAAGIISSSYLIKYCANTWMQIKQSTAYEATYTTVNRWCTSLTDRIFSFHNLH
ncbi:hypothetical protein A3F66_00665 [candidate division TM6 bacterium RIFCSPHIGHO2_12_FULL_32_22]|nr:MAG: hypothetical protein A3F66_00665 [candidate division TM6 bacterium RIFCSPHIGHO2_12_FULL_32_22]